MGTRAGGRQAGTVVPFARQEGRRRWLWLDEDARPVLALVATHTGSTPEALLGRARGKAELAHARQLAMYLCHVALGRTLASVGRSFGRDRSTVSYACAQIEDMRDDAAFDADVEALEARIETNETLHEARHAAG